MSDVHFEAPKAERLAGEMGLFLNWFEGAAAIDPVRDHTPF
jgi:hypothetical protein